MGHGKTKYVVAEGSSQSYQRVRSMTVTVISRNVTCTLSQAEARTRWYVEIVIFSKERADLQQKLGDMHRNFSRSTSFATVTLGHGDLVTIQGLALSLAAQRMLGFATHHVSVTSLMPPRRGGAGLCSEHGNLCELESRLRSVRACQR